MLCVKITCMYCNKRIFLAAVYDCFQHRMALFHHDGFGFILTSCAVKNEYNDRVSSNIHTKIIFSYDYESITKYDK